MNSNNSTSSSKSIEQLLKELSDLHKQFDSINVEKTMHLNNSKSIIKKKLSNTNKIIDVKSNSLSPQPKTAKPTDLIIKDDNLNENFKNKVNEINGVELKTEKQMPEKEEVNTSAEAPTIDIAKNNDNLNESYDDNLNESYLSIKDKLEKIKSEIKEKEKNYNINSSNINIKKDTKINNTKESELSATIKEKKLINKNKNSSTSIPASTSKPNKQLSEDEALALSKKKSNTLTIIILVLIIIILLSIYFYFFR